MKVSDLRQREKPKNPIKTGYYKFLNFIMNNKIKTLLLIFILSIIIFPSFYGEYIGLWLKNFVESFKNIYN